MSVKGVTDVTECDSLHMPLHSASASEHDAGQPTETEFLAYCASPVVGILASEAADLFGKCEQRGWKDGGKVEIVNWKAYVRRMRKFIEQDRAKNRADNRREDPNI